MKNLSSKLVTDQVKGGRNVKNPAICTGTIAFTLALASAVGYGLLGRVHAAPGSKQVPMFQVDPSWPKPLPNRWLVGSVIGVAVDSRDHIWIVHRPKSLQPNEIRAAWKSAPPVLEFDQQGNLVQ